MPVSFETASTYLFYEPDTGILRWIESTYRRGKAGERAGTIKGHGYWYISLFGKGYKAAQIAWLLMTGEWPPRTVDHINRNPADDRWENLRLATQSQQNANRNITSKNKSGYRGVSWSKEKRQWTVRVAGRYCGYFDDKKEAARQYDMIAKHHFGEFASLNFPEETPNM